MRGSFVQIQSGSLKMASFLVFWILVPFVNLVIIVWCLCNQLNNHRVRENFQVRKNDSGDLRRFPHFRLPASKTSF